jgi:pSer/pThr/pTyr-binding forkhead associated (FHA) protein
MAQQAVLSGPPGIYPVAPGREVRVGRDPGMADICLTEPRISGMHGTLKFESGALYVRDEGSNNGTFVSGSRVASHVWTAVPAGAIVKFGPIEFSVRLE